MLETLLHGVRVYGAAIIFLVALVEGIGVPLPAETVLVSGAAFSAAGRLEIGWVVAAAVLGGALGSAIGYWIGLRGGEPFVRRFGARLRLGTEVLPRTRAFFDRYGPAAIVGCRFVAVLRSYVGLMAGVAHMPFRRFMAYNALGAVVWAGVFSGLGYGFGRTLPRVERGTAAAMLTVALLATLGVALVMVARASWNARETIWRTVEGWWQRLAGSATARRLAQRYPGALQFIVRRLTPGAYLGLHLTIGMVVSLGALWLFGGILEDVVEGDPLTRFDIALDQRLHASASPAGLAVSRLLSDIGSFPSMLVLAVVLAAAFVLARRRLFAQVWVAAVFGGGLLNLGLKDIVRRPRPVFTDPFAVVPSWSFPSGHAMGSLIAFSMIAYFLFHRVRSGAGRAAIIGAAALLILGIGASRLYLGVHYFSDVVGGYAAGIVWVAACISGAGDGAAPAGVTPARPLTAAPFPGRPPPPRRTTRGRGATPMRRSRPEPSGRPRAPVDRDFAERSRRAITLVVWPRVPASGGEGRGARAGAGPGEERPPQRNARRPAPPDHQRGQPDLVPGEVEQGERDAGRHQAEEAPAAHDRALRDRERDAAGGHRHRGEPVEQDDPRRRAVPLPAAGQHQHQVEQVPARAEQRVRDREKMREVRLQHRRRAASEERVPHGVPEMDLIAAQVEPDAEREERQQRLRDPLPPCRRVVGPLRRDIPCDVAVPHLAHVCLPHRGPFPLDSRKNRRKRQTILAAARALPVDARMVGVFDVAEPGMWIRVLSAAGAFFCAALALAHARLRWRAHGERFGGVSSADGVAGGLRWAAGFGLVACGIWGWTLGWPVALYLTLGCLGLVVLALALLLAVAGTAS